MAVTIQLRNVPEEVHRELKRRAAKAGMSLSEFLVREVTALVARPGGPEMRRRLDAMRIPGVRTPPERVIREARDGR